MVDSFLSIYPDKESHLLWESEPVPFYLSPAIVRSRADRYKIVPSSSKPGTSVLRVYSAVSCTFPSVSYFSSIRCSYFISFPFVFYYSTQYLMFSFIQLNYRVLFESVLYGFTANTTHLILNMYQTTFPSHDMS